MTQPTVVPPLITRVRPNCCSALRRRVDSLNGSSVVLVGDHGTGKTALMAHVYKWARQQPHLHCAWIDMQDGTQQWDRLCFWEACLRAFDQKPPPDTIQSAVAAARRCRYSQSSLEEVFLALLHARQRLIVFVDEFHLSLYRPGLMRHEFWGSLRALTGRFSEALLIVGASFHSVYKLSQELSCLKEAPDESDFLNAWSTQIIGALSDAVAPIDLICAERDRSGPLGERRAQLAALGGGNLKLAVAIAEFLVQHPGGDLREALPALVSNQRGVFETWWSAWAGLARQTVCRVAVEHLSALTQEPCQVVDAPPPHPPAAVMPELHGLFARMFNRIDLRQMLARHDVPSHGLPGESASIDDYVAAALELMGRHDNVYNAVAHLRRSRPNNQAIIDKVLLAHGLGAWCTLELPPLHDSQRHDLDQRGTLVERDGCWRIGPLLFLWWFQGQIEEVRDGDLTAEKWLERRKVARDERFTRYWSYRVDALRKRWPGAQELIAHAGQAGGA